MREILFKGKRADNGKWVHGCLVSIRASNIKTTDEKTNQKVYCITNPYIPFEITVNDVDNLDLAIYRVIHETIGQYTGLTDKNGKKIFEGDIVKVYEDIDYRVGIHKTNRKTRTIIGVVVFDEKRFEYKIKNEKYNLTLFRLSKKDTNEIIGNIHDNPELLESEGDAK